MLDLIAIAWGVDPDTVFGGPAWLQWDRFDIVAKAPPDTSRQNLRLMLQALLADRFGLVVRNDMKPLPAFALIAGGGKPKLKPAAGMPSDSACETEARAGCDPGDDRIVAPKHNGEGICAESAWIVRTLDREARGGPVRSARRVGF